MKKIITLLSAATMMLVLSMCFTASAKEMTEDQFTVVCDNVVYELIREYERVVEEGQKWWQGKTVLTNRGEAYRVTNFFYDKEEAEKMTEINILSEVNGLPVTHIWVDDDQTEKYKKNITKVTIPDTVKYIGPYDFSDFTAIKTIKLPENLEVLNSGVFADCTSLETVIFNDSLREILTKTFKNCSSLTEVSLPKNLKKIGSYAFLRSGLKEIDIPEKCVIKHRAFKECKNLEKATINYSGEKSYTVPKSAFYKCKNLEAVYFTNLKTQIVTGAYAYTGCKKLKDIYFFGSQSLWEEVCMSGKRSEYYKNFNMHFYNDHTHEFKKVKGAKNTLKFTCDCGDEFIFTAKDIGEHNYTKWNTCKKSDCITGTKHTFTCKDCGEKATFKLKESSRHSYGKWKTVKKATVKAEGEMKRTCADCKKTDTKAVKKLKDVSELSIYISDHQKETQIYKNGKAVKIPVDSVYDKNKALTKNLHYKLIYKNTKKVTNKATVIVKGIEENGYTGQVKFTYTILPRQPLEQKVDIVNDTFELNWNELPEADGYKVYCHESKTDKIVADVYITETSYTIEGIEPKEQYYIEIGSYTEEDGEKIFSRRNMFWVLNEKD